MEESEHAKLYDLRKKYLVQVIKKNDALEIATTYDKIAGDFESRNKQDSAIIYYLKAKKIIDTIIIDTSKSNLQLSLIYYNIGKCFAYGSNKNINKANINLDKAIFLSRKYPKVYLSILRDKITLQLDYKNNQTNKDLIISNLNNYKNFIKENDSIFMFYHLDLLSEFYYKFQYNDSLLNIYYKINKLISQYNNIEKISDIIQHKLLDNSCGYDIREISIIAKKGALPVLFFDVNNNMIYDQNDYAIMPKNASIDNNQVNELGSKESILWLESLEVKQAKNFGFFELSLGKEDANTPKVKNSICFAVPEGNSVNWKFRFDCSELKYLDSKVFVGLKNAIINQNNQIISVDNILKFTPILPVNTENVRYSMSTYEVN
jgi:hypothetical protein